MIKAARHGESGDSALVALERLLAVLDEVEQQFDTVRQRAAIITRERRAGRSYSELVPAEDRPLVVQLLSGIQDKLAAAGAEWRREEARALHREGVSMDRIAALFGVTRQRVSALLASGSGGHPPAS